MDLPTGPSQVSQHRKNPGLSHPSNRLKEANWADFGSSNQDTPPIDRYGERHSVFFRNGNHRDSAPSDGEGASPLCANIH